MKLEVYDANDTGWAGSLRRIPPENADINFTPEWYLTWQEHEQAIPRCIVAETDGYLFFYPFLLKPIEGYDLGNTYYDIQTAYGYGGVITNHTDVPPELISRFNMEVNHWLTDNNVVAEFIREHPLLNHCRRDAEYFRVRHNVYIETSRKYIVPDKKARQNVSKVRRNPEISIQIDSEMSHLDEFIRLYNMNAIRLNMGSFYHFPDSYFRSVKDMLHHHARLIHIRYQDKIINTALFLFYGNKGTMHLAGSDHQYQAIRGNDLLYYIAIELSKNIGLEILSIGGGLTTAEDDSLFRFKSKFSNFHKEVMAGKKILNPAVFDELTSQWEKKYPELKEKYRNFFLKYRQTD